MLKLIIIGAGHRVCEAMLPVVINRTKEIKLIGIYSKSKKDLQVLGDSYSVQMLDELDSTTISSADLIYCAIPALAIPAVLNKLFEKDVSRTDILIDTPGLHVKNISMFKMLNKFRNAWLAEDVLFLPWIETIRKAEKEYKLGRMRRITLDQSGWDYHGIALLKALFEDDTIKSTKINKNIYQAKQNKKLDEFHLMFKGKKNAVMLCPRDYENGNITIEYENGKISSVEEPDSLIISACIDGKQCIGFQVDNLVTKIEGFESDLFGAHGIKGVDAHIIHNMHNCKRVALSRLLDNISKGDGGYSFIEGMDNLWINYLSTVIGRWYSTPFSSVKSPLFRFMMSSAWKLHKIIRGR